MSVIRNAESLSILILAASVAVVVNCLGVAAQPPLPGAGNPDDLRPVYSTPGDIAEGKELAKATCAACHGANGISPKVGIPNLASQRPAYLYLELKAYQSGARGDSAMNNTVKFLSDDALVKVAAYYANLDPAPPTGVAPKAAPDPLQAGKAAAGACAGCHGETGVSKTPGMPNLAGLDPKYLVSAMKAYKSGQRKNELMKSMLAAASEADINNIALFYALQQPSRSATPASGDKEAGKAAAEACAGCHGQDGISTIPTTPSLAGQDAEYLAAAIRAYKDGSRSDETMKGLASALDGNAIKNLPAFYTTLQPKRPDVRKPLTTEEWTQRCDRCHGLNGNSTDPRLPALAAQRLDYLEKVLNAYRTGTRKSKVMAAMADVLTEEDVVNLAAYYAGQTGRAVVFMPVPAK